MEKNEKIEQSEKFLEKLDKQKFHKISKLYNEDAREEGIPHKDFDKVDQASWESFPASDSPSWNP